MATMSGIALEGRLDDLAAVDARQAQVGDDDVEREPVEPLERGFAVSASVTWKPWSVSRSATAFVGILRRLRGADVWHFSHCVKASIF